MDDDGTCIINYIDHLSKLHWEFNQDIEIQNQNLLNSVLQLNWH